MAILAVVLIVLAVLDFRTYRLPDALTLPLVPLGLLARLLLDGTGGFWDGVVGAATGFSSLFLVSRAYRALRGREGLGLGDAKLFAGVGAWLGVALLAPTLFISALLGLIYALSLRLLGHDISSKTIIPFGPFLCAGFLLMWVVQRFTGLF